MKKLLLAIFMFLPVLVLAQSGFIPYGEFIIREDFTDAHADNTNEQTIKEHTKADYNEVFHLGVWLDVSNLIKQTEFRLHCKMDDSSYRVYSYELFDPATDKRTMIKIDALECHGHDWKITAQSLVGEGSEKDILTYIVMRL